MHGAVEPGRGDPFSLPGLVHLGRLKPGYRAGDFAGVGPDRDPPEIAGRRLQSDRQQIAEAVDRVAFAAVMNNLLQSSVCTHHYLSCQLDFCIRGFSHPAQRRLAQVKSEWIFQMITHQMFD